MSYCRKCGTKLTNDAKFCHQCGCSVMNESTGYTQRRQEFEGKMYKCPNCGKILKSFVLNCPACGYELRGARTSSAVKEFALKLEAIEARREYEKPYGFFATAEAQQRVSKTDAQKISLIKCFTVPNTKEDMLEFMILATSNMNMRTYDSANTDISKSEREVNAAWFSKVQQVYEKAKRSYSTDSIFAEIKMLYDNCNEEIKKSKKKGIIKRILMLGWIPIVLLAWVVLNFVEEPKEIKRLEAIVVEVQEALENGEYKLALNYADSIDYQRFDAEMEQKWDIEREYWVDKVLEEATANGVDLEYMATPDIDRANNEPVTRDSINSGFVEGIKESVQSGVDATEENINEFNAIMDETKDKSQQTTISEVETISIGENDYITNTIEKGTTYTYGYDEWGLYCATAISDSVISIDKWEKNLSLEKSFNKKYEVGMFKITDAQYEFTWIDEDYTAFSFTLTDKNNGDFKKSKNIVFTILGVDGDTNKGTNYNKKNVCYSYRNDDWHLYRAIPLTDLVMKIECWYRPLALGSFHYGYDICVININAKDTDFEWTDDEHTSFTISIQDKENSDLKNSTFVAFTQD